jgi:hypothetical protein
MEAGPAMTQLTSVSGSFRAHVLLARLEAEGIDAQLRGALDGAYGFTMGDLARVDVYVPDDQLDDAKYVLLADEVDATLAAPTEWGDGEVWAERWDGDSDGHRSRPGGWVRWVALTMLTVAVVGVVLRSISW